MSRTHLPLLQVANSKMSAQTAFTVVSFSCKQRSAGE